MSFCVLFMQRIYRCEVCQREWPYRSEKYAQTVLKKRCNEYHATSEGLALERGRAEPHNVLYAILSIRQQRVHSSNLITQLRAEGSLMHRG